MRHFSFPKLIVTDLEKSAAFYKTVAGLTEQARVDAVMEGRPIKEIMLNPTHVQIPRRRARRCSCC